MFQLLSQGRFGMTLRETNVEVSHKMKNDLRMRKEDTSIIAGTFALGAMAGERKETKVVPFRPLASPTRTRTCHGFRLVHVTVSRP